MKRHSLLFLLLGSLWAFSCGGGSSAQQQEENTASDTTATSATQYLLSPFTPSTKYADAAMESMEYKDAKFNFGIGGESYQLGVQTPDAPQKMCANSGEGQHIHLIIDKEPYAAKYQASFDYEIPDGEHYLLAFLSRSYHESIKNEKAHIAKKVTVAGNNFTDIKDIEGPMLFYSRPKGAYKGKAETEKVMLDFYLVNAQIGNEYNVLAEINGEEHLIDIWQPYYIEGLPMGENTIKLSLLDRDGNLVNTPNNPVERTFTLEELALEK